MELADSPFRYETTEEATESLGKVGSPKLLLVSVLQGRPWGGECKIITLALTCLFPGDTYLYGKRVRLLNAEPTIF